MFNCEWLGMENPDFYREEKTRDSEPIFTNVKKLNPSAHRHEYH
jgi:hypothetical protein